MNGSSVDSDASRTRTRRHVRWCLMPQVLFALLGIGVVGGQWWTSLTVVFLLVVVPGLDRLTGWQDDQRFLAKDFRTAELAVLRYNVRFYAVLNIASVILLTVSLERFNGLEIGFLLASASLISAIGFASAHELLHGQTRFDQVLQAILTPFLFYPHYKVIHVYSHHVHVSTHLDENTAWRSESIYRYLWRTVPGSMLRCWKLECERTERGKNRLQLLRNHMLFHGAGQALLLTAFYCVSGFPGLLFYIGHIIGAHIVLESVNYIQHYGLLRDRVLDASKYQRTGPEHSWDTYHFFSSYVTFRAGHHSNHHVSAGPYYLLAPETAAAKLPLGYFWAIALVLLPPWWRATIDPKLPASASS